MNGSGFKEKFNDGTTGQIQHFLTGLNISLNFTQSPDSTKLALAAIVGHEIFPDDGLAFVGSYVQVVVGVTRENDIASFLRGTDEDFNNIYNNRIDYFGRSGGNSVEDLRLSKAAWDIGQNLKNDGYNLNEDLAKTLEEILRGE